jgi:hypothetical protein
MASVKVNVELVVDQKALRALQLLVELCSDLAIDFDYRDDVKRGLRAARYLLRNVRVEAS